MIVQVNDRSVPVRDGATLTELLKHLAVEGPVAMEVNGVFVPQRDREAWRLNAGDEVRLVQIAMGG